MLETAQLKTNDITVDPKDGRFYMFVDRQIKDGNGKTRRIRKRKKFPKGISEAQARETLNRYLYATMYRFGEKDCTPWDEEVTKMVKDSQSWLNQTYNKIKYRDKKYGRATSLTVGDIEHLLRMGKGRCAITGIPFDFSKADGCSRAPYQPSIDRIDNSKGYRADNIRIVCLAVNIAMADWGEEIFSTIASGYVFKKYDLTVRQP